jgi:hypothetical protein
MAESTPPPFDRSQIHRCGTTEYMEKLKAEDPSLKGRLDDYEVQVQQYINKNDPSSSPQRPLKKDKPKDGAGMCFDVALSMAGGCFLIPENKK